jgi:hypothetical protein
MIYGQYFCIDLYIVADIIMKIIGAICVLDHLSECIYIFFDIDPHSYQDILPSIALQTIDLV